jgi:hypothetical protein
MGRKYWLDRELSALTMARNASSAESRLVHFQLAGSYSIKAAASDPFLSPCELDSQPSPETASRSADVTSFYVSPAGVPLRSL